MRISDWSSDVCSSYLFCTRTNRRPVIRVPTLCKIRPSDNTFMYLTDCFRHIGPGTTLVPHLHLPVIFPGRFNHQLPLMRIMAAGFLQVHMFPGFTSQNGRRRMPMIRCRDRKSTRLNSSHYCE